MSTIGRNARWMVRRSIYNRFGDIAGFVREEPVFPHPTPIPAKICGCFCSIWSRSMMLRSALQKVRL